MVSVEQVLSHNLWITESLPERMFKICIKGCSDKVLILLFSKSFTKLYPSVKGFGTCDRDVLFSLHFAPWMLQLFIIIVFYITIGLVCQMLCHRLFLPTYTKVRKMKLLMLGTHGYHLGLIKGLHFFFSASYRNSNLLLSHVKSYQASKFCKEETEFELQPEQTSASISCC